MRGKWPDLHLCQEKRETELHFKLLLLHLLSSSYYRSLVREILYVIIISIFMMMIPFSQASSIIMFFEGKLCHHNSLVNSNIWKACDFFFLDSFSFMNTSMFHSNEQTYAVSLMHVVFVVCRFASATLCASHAFYQSVVCSVIRFPSLNHWEERKRRKEDTEAKEMGGKWKEMNWCMQQNSRWNRISFSSSFWELCVCSVCCFCMQFGVCE